MPLSRRDNPIPGPHFRVDRTAPELSVVIPVWEEEEVLPELLARLGKVLDDLGLDAEVIFVDDGSRDDTPHLLEQAARDDARINALCLSRNFGHQAAISAGIAEAAGDAVVVMDGDLQDPPEAIPLLLERLAEGYDVVYAVRAGRPESWPKRLAYACFYRLQRRCVNLPIPIDAGDFGVMTRRVVDVINGLPERRRFVRGLRAWAGFRQTGVPIQRSPRAAGAPKYTWGRLLGLALDGIVGFSDAPLRTAGALGVAAMGGSVLVGGAAALGGSGSSLPWVGALILFFGGAQLFCTAVLGEYVSRALQEARGRPTHVVRERIGFDREEARVLSSPSSARYARPRG